MPRITQPITRERWRAVNTDGTGSETPFSISSERLSSDGSDFEEKRPPKRAKRSGALESSQNAKRPAQDITVPKGSAKISGQPSASRRTKTAKYDFSANAASLFPNWPAPTLKQVQKVFQLLEDKHGKIEISQAKPSLMLEIEGCNEEEPALIDAIVRARLSAGTNDMNASRAFMGILKTFGRRRPGSGIGIVDWEAVRLAPVEDLYEAIKTGGMGNVKSRSVKAILDMVHDENLVRQKWGNRLPKQRGWTFFPLNTCEAFQRTKHLKNSLRSQA